MPASSSAVTTIEASSDKTSTSLNARQYNCCYCHRAFTRAEHLRRHLMLHTGEKKYRCHCGLAFSRSDVLARHVKGCEQRSVVSESCDSISPVKRRRVKRACDRCARLKAKCDYHNPCERCDGKRLVCEYSRENNPDLRLIYGLEERTPINDQANSSQDVSQGFPLPSTTLQQTENQRKQSSVIREGETHVPLTYDRGPSLNGFDPTVNEIDQQQLLTNWMDVGFNHDAAELASHSQNFQRSGHEMIDADAFGFEMDNFAWSPMALAMTAMFDNSSPATSTAPVSAGPADAVPSTRQKTKAVSCFSIEQLDPLEAICVELRALLRGAGPTVPEDVISSCMTRENLLLALTLHGQHFQRNLPILHSPTFNLIAAPPVLLLAMFCVGACYSTAIVPGNYVFKMAVHVLVNIEHQPHEIDMQAPSLSTIQASMSACSVLACSQDEYAFKVVSVYFARGTSMAKRAKIFDAVDPIDYTNMTESEFDWHAWVYNETRNRIACTLFGQDVASCMFQGAVPTLSPFDLDVELPSYAACWEARSASECLQLLKSYPSQLRVSTAIRQLCAPSFSETGSYLQASAFGMFTLVNGLHCLIFHATHYSIEAPPNPSHSLPSLQPSGGSDIASCLEQDFSGPAISKMAAEVIASQGPGTLSNVSQSLENWMRTWESRQVQDGEYESRAFALDPVPFYWLAKLFLLLHCGASGIPDGSEFAKLRLKGFSIKGPMQMQAKIFGWLSRLRSRGRSKKSTAADASLAGLMGPIDGGAEA